MEQERRCSVHAIFSHLTGNGERSDEQGVAIVEMSYVAPLLVLLLIGITDIGRALNTYLVMTQIAHESVRLGTLLPDLEPDAVNTVAPGANECDSEHARQERHGIWHSCKRALLLKHLQVASGPTTGSSGLVGELNVKPESWEVTAEFIDSPTNPENTNGRTVRVRVSGEYEPIFRIFGRLPISVEASGPYLGLS